MREGRTLESDRKDEDRQTSGWKDRKCFRFALYATISIGKLTTPQTSLFTTGKLTTPQHFPINYRYMNDFSTIVPLQLQYINDYSTIVPLQFQVTDNYSTIVH